MESITVIIVQPGQFAFKAEIENSLEMMQKVVGGDIEATYPFEDPVALICNEDGKMLTGTYPNRALYDQDGRIVDIVFGTFFLCGIGREDFTGLSDELADKLLERFRYPEEICFEDGRLKVEQIKGA